MYTASTALQRSLLIFFGLLRYIDIRKTVEHLERRSCLDRAFECSSERGSASQNFGHAFLQQHPCSASIEEGRMVMEPQRKMPRKSGRRNGVSSDKG